MDKKTLVLVGTVLTLVLGVIASLVAWFAGGKALENGPAREAIRKMFNFELNYLIIAILLGWIPIIGQLLVLGLWIANIVFAIKAFQAGNSEAEVNIPGFEFIK